MGLFLKQMERLQAVYEKNGGRVIFSLLFSFMFACIGMCKSKDRQFQLCIIRPV